MEDTDYPLWFNLEEFEEFINSNLLDEAVNVQTRMKLARAARRTSKRRSFIRKIRSKRRKSMGQLRQRAFRVVRNQIRKRLHKGNWSKLSYSERARIDGVIDKRKKFIKNVVRQIMPKIVKGESERLRKLNRKKVQNESFFVEEKTKSEVRQSATERKRLQRSRESQLRQLDPAKLAMVVNNEKGEVLIVDKNSFEPENHKVVVPANEMNFEVAKKFSQDPNFKNTLTSQRILGTKVGGEIVSVKDYGVFIELDDGIEGLIHVSEMSWTNKIKNPTKHFNAGDRIEAQVLDVDVENKRISLGLKQLQPNPWDALVAKYKVGDKVKGKVKSIVDFGVFVEVGEDMDALIHVSDISWTRKNIVLTEEFKEWLLDKFSTARNFGEH